MKQEKVWTPEARKAFGEKMKAARAAKGVCQPKPEAKKPEAKELSDIPKSGNVDVYVKNPIKLNGVSYGGRCNVPIEIANELKYRSDMVDERTIKEKDGTDHGMHLIGNIG
jgi:hypothetical protein